MWPIFPAVATDTAASAFPVSAAAAAAETDDETSRLDCALALRVTQLNPATINTTTRPAASMSTCMCIQTTCTIEVPGSWQHRPQ